CMEHSVRARQAYEYFADAVRVARCRTICPLRGDHDRSPCIHFDSGAKPDMPTNRIPVRLSLLAASLSLVLLAGCTQDASTGDVASDASNQATDPLTAAAESAAQATDAGQASATSLKPNERVQGTIQFDMGNGPVSYRSIATKLDENLGRKTAERLGSAAGQRALAKANDRAGGKVQVSAQDVQDMADTFAGKTIYT